MKKLFCILFLLSSFIIYTFSQPVPTVEENIPYLVTFGSNGDISWGDDDHCQIFFFVIPKAHKTPIYIRVFDPDVGGKIDEIKEACNTKTRFSVYGGKEAYSHKDAQQTQPVGKYKSGNLLAAKIFGVSEKYDNNWYTFGPFNPTEGEYIEKFEGYIFKVIAEGIAGDDGNLYRYYLSTEPNSNKGIEGGNSFTYEYTFRMWDDPNNISHIYPYIEDNVIFITQSNFDWDNDGVIRIISVAKNGVICKTSGEANWEMSKHKIVEEEKNTSFDIQFIKSKTHPAGNNNVVLYIRNQYDELMPFHNSPIGGIPKYKYNIGVKKAKGK